LELTKLKTTVMNWISITEKYPLQYNDVLLGTCSNEIGEGFWNGTEFVAYRQDFDLQGVTHWMHLDSITVVPVL
jgi:hypothetical protein